MALNVGELFAKLSLDDKRFSDGLDRGESRMESFGAKVSGLAKKAAGGVAVLGAGVAALGGVATGASMSFEQAFAGVRKTLDVTGLGAVATKYAFEQIKEGLLDMSKEVPIAAEELTKIAELAGQLGVGRESILDFTRTIAEIGVASDLTTEEAATAFAQFSNIMGTPQTETRRLGDAIINLGNNLATTEASIMNFGLRIAGAGKIAGLTEEQVFAIGAAMSSVGVEAEAGGTSVQKVLLGITEAVATGSEKLGIFAKTAGLTVQDFKTMWEKDAAGAFQLFVEGLGTAGTDAFAILEGLGLTDQRLTRAFLSLAGAGDLLGNSFELAADSAGALATEAGTFFSTTSNRWQTFKNTARDALITVGDALSPVFGAMIDLATDWLKASEPLIEAIGSKLAGAVSGLVSGLEGLTGTLGSFMDIVRTATTGDLQGLHEAFLKLPESLWGVGQAIVDVIGFFKGLGEAVSQGGLATFMQEGIQGAIESAISWIQANLPKVIESILKSRARFMDAALKVFGVIVDALAAAVPAIVEGLSELVGNTLPELLTSVVPELLDSAVELFTQIVYGLETMIPQILAVVTTELIPRLLSLVTSAVPLLLASAQTLFMALIDGLEVIIPGLVAAVSGLLDAGGEVVSTIVGLVPDILEAAITLFMALVDAIPEILPDLVNVIVGDLVPTVVETVLGALPVLLDAAITLFLALVQAVPRIIPDLLRIITTVLIPTVITTLIRLVPQLVSTGVQLIGGLVEGVVRAIPQVLGAIGSVIGGIVSAVAKLPGSMWDAGRNVIEGLWNGIKSAGNWIKTKVMEFVKNIIPGPIRAVLGIHSPSKLMENMMRAVPQGMVRGMEWGARDVAKAAESLAAASVPMTDGLAAGLAGGGVSLSFGDINTRAAVSARDIVDEVMWQAQTRLAVAR